MITHITHTWSPVTDVVCENSLIKWTHTSHCMFQHVSVTATVTCVNGSVCEQCKNLTTGPQCQICLPGYYGDPTNGGKCQGEIFLFMCMCTSICLSVCVLVCICIWNQRVSLLRMILSLWNKINLAEYLDVVFHWMKVNNTYGYQATKNTSTTKVVNLIVPYIPNIQMTA